MKNFDLIHHRSLWSAFALRLPLLVFTLGAPAVFAAGYPEVERPIESMEFTSGFSSDLSTEASMEPFADLSIAPLSRAKAKGNRHVGKALREIGRVDLTGTALSGAALASSGMPSASLDASTLEEPLGGQFDSGVLEQRGLENGGRYETNGFETPLKGWFGSNPEVPVAFKYRHPVRR